MLYFLPIEANLFENYEFEFCNNLLSFCMSVPLSLTKCSHSRLSGTAPPVIWSLNPPGVGASLCGVLSALHTVQGRPSL